MKIHSVGSVKANQLLKAGFQTIQALKDSDNIEEYLNEPQMKGLKWYEDSLQRIPREEIIDHAVEMIDPNFDHPYAWNGLPEELLKQAKDLWKVS